VGPLVSDSADFSLFSVVSSCIFPKKGEIIYKSTEKGGPMAKKVEAKAAAKAPVAAKKTAKKPAKAVAKKK
jgi:hypothetical protein